jgi:hypothetical protein
MHNDARYGIEEGRSLDDAAYCFLTKSMTMLPGSRWR